MMRDGRVDRRTLISHRYPLNEIAEAFAAQMRPDAVKVMLDIAAA